MRITDLKTIKLALLCAFLMPGCIVAESGDDDDDSVATEGESESASASATASGSNSGPSSDSDSSDSDPSDSDPTDSDPSDSDATDSEATDTDPSDSDATDSDPTDSGGSSSGGMDTDASSDSSSDGPLEEGAWTYDETGASVDCGAAPTPTNGFGSFLIESSTAAGFTIVPNDGTDPFDCDLDAGAYVCPERLVDTTGQAGTDVSLNAFVSVEGDTLSSSSLTGTQFGRLDCEGSECGTAELLLGTTFPCTFEIDFAATKN